MNPATIGQSTRSLTDAIYKVEHFNNQDQKEREAMDMDTFHRQTLLQKMKEADESFKERQELAIQAEEERKRDQALAEARHKQEKELEDKYNKEIEDHWYWGGVLGKNERSEFTHADNHLDNLKDDNYHSVELSKGFRQITKHKPRHEKLSGYSKDAFVYKAPFREYSYDYSNDKLYPNDKRYLTEDNVLNLQQKCLSDNSVESAFERKFEEKTGETPTSEVKENFQSEVDPKLKEIYTKTLSPQENLPKENQVSLFTYWHCLILVIIFFLLFRNNN